MTRRPVRATPTIRHGGLTLGGLTLVLALLVGCGTANGEPGETGGAEATDEIDDPATRPAPVPALDPSTVCGQARACCAAYAAAMPDVVEEAACAGPHEVAADADADARCRAMAEGWREALRLMPDVEPPPACSP